jgi:toxin ParE1/3/4
VPNNFHKRPQADADLDAIWSYIAVDNVGAANALIERIGQVFKMLVQNPLAGRERPDLQRGLRSFPVGSYLVFYVPAARRHRNRCVMHGRQDINADDMT